jgi:hypothetical protein
VCGVFVWVLTGMWCLRGRASLHLSISRYHSGSPLGTLHVVRGGASALLLGANSHRAVVWDYRAEVLLATVALDLGDAVVLPPNRPSVTLFDAVSDSLCVLGGGRAET